MSGRGGGGGGGGTCCLTVAGISGLALTMVC